MEPVRGGSGPLDFSDVERLIELTAIRATAAQDAKNNTEQILSALNELNMTTRELTQAVTRVQGVAEALAAYMSTRNGAELDRLREIMSDSSESGVTVHVEQQTGGTRADADRDVNIAGGSIERKEQ